MMRFAAVLLTLVALATPAAAQGSAEAGQMRLYIQQLEQKVRELTGQNEQLTYELNRLRVAAGQAAGPPGAPAAGQAASLQPELGPGAPPQDLGTLSVSPNDPLIAPDSVEGDPMDLSDLAAEGAPADGEIAPPAGPAVRTGGLPPAPGKAVKPGAVASLSGSPRDEYDLAYGYILTGDYALAEKSFENWLKAFPNDPQASDARFWLGETQYAQKNYRQAANSYLALYKAAPQSAKAPDALFKLGVSLAALGEKKAACATLIEVGKKYPQASAALKSRVSDESGRAGCS